MILHRVILENVGVFGGRNLLELTPPDRERPVTLIGALNGGGKTTLLGALQLALYGPRAQGIERNRRGYHRYLKELIHRGAGPEEDAAVELEFERRIDGRAAHYRIRRAWRVRDGAVEERFDVTRDGDPDALLASHWDESIDAFLPARLAHLFFFDGEQIERMADEEAARGVLATAFQSLLGLDLVEKLQEDLNTLERRKRLVIRSPDDRAKLAVLEEEARAAESALQGAHDDVASVNGTIAQRQAMLDRLRARFKAEGGDHYERREALESRRAEIVNRLATVEAEFREIVAGPGPFLLVPDLLADLRRQAELEEEARRETIVAEAEAIRDRKVLDELAKRIDPKALQLVEGALARHRPARDAIDLPRVLDADDGFAGRLDDLIRHELPKARARMTELDQEMTALRSELDEIDRRLAAVPDADALARLQSDMVRLGQEIADLGRELTARQERARIAQFDLGIRTKALQREMGRHVDDWESAEHDRRIIERIPRVRGTLEQFRQKVVARHAGALERAIIESFQHLARKPKLLGSVQIDPETFEMRLADPAGGHVPFQLLSAGERQLLATAILWALAKVSGRPVPLVIDTPLGRLDSHHRAHVVQRYFPAASHQVILLSTDEEIVGRYLEMLTPTVGHAYLLAHDESTQRSTVQRGYFNGK